LNSLERSLQIGLVSSLIVLMFVFWWSVTLTSRMLTDSYVFTQLEKLAFQANASVDYDSPDFTIDDITRGFILRRDGVNLFIPEFTDIQNLIVPDLVPGQIVRRSAVDDSGQPLRIWYGGFSRNGERVVLGVLQDVSGIVDRLRVFQWFAAILAMLLLIVLLGVQKLILRRSVNKLEGIRRDMLRLEHGQAVALSEDVPSEVMPLVLEFNQLLRRFEQRLRQSRNSVGNLAHSLKGPLNLLIRSSNSPSLDESSRSAIAHNAEHIRRLIESELKRARLAGRGAVGIRFDVDTELPAMIGLLEQVYADKKVKVSFEIAKEVQLVHDRQDMLELIGNLLDNAVKWSRSRVVLKMHDHDGVVIDVEDDGPGCSPEVLDQLTGRGVRLGLIDRQGYS